MSVATVTRLRDDDGLRRIFEIQAEHCARMGAPFNGRVCRLLADTLDDESAFGRRLMTWPRENRGGDLLAIRCCAGLHALARAKTVPALSAVYPPAACSDDALLDAITHAIAQEDAFLTRYLDSAPQTNEIGRSAILLGGLLTIAKLASERIALFELGASAGLNLMFDRWHYDLGDVGRWGQEDSAVRISCRWTGTAPDLATTLTIVTRAAGDLAPLDPADPAHRERLLSYIWPDQAERLARTAAACAIAAATGSKVEKADARTWLAQRLAPNAAQDGTVTVLFHSVFIQYLDPPVRAALIDDISARGRAATTGAPFAWLRMEANADNRAQCELRLTLWPGGEERQLALVDWHGSSADWQPDPT